MNYNYELVEVARESRSLTQEQLAARLGIGQGTLSKIEVGIKPLTADLVVKIAECLEYRPEFFESSDRVYGLGISNLFHRKRHDVGVKRLRAIHAQINIRRIHISRMLKGVELGEPRFPGLEVGEGAYKTAADVARAVRALWNLPMGPVQNVVRAIEDAGGVIVPFDFGTTRVDAVSQCIPSEGLYLFFVSVHVPADRMRFTLMHEVGHIVMHSLHPDMESAEREADMFASEFLMPAREIRMHLENVTLQKLAMLKSYWKVSMNALLYRAEQLEAITKNQSRYLWAQMSAKGYRTREPEELDLPPEQPSLYQEIVDTYRHDMGYSVGEFSRILGLYEGETQREFYADRRRLSIVR